MIVASALQDRDCWYPDVCVYNTRLDGLDDQVDISMNYIDNDL